MLWVLLLPGMMGDVAKIFLSHLCVSNYGQLFSNLPVDGDDAVLPVIDVGEAAEPLADGADAALTAAEDGEEEEPAAGPLPPG